MSDAQWPIAVIAPHMHVISDNDYSGVPDCLVQLAHHAPSPSVELRLVIGSHLRAVDPWDPTPSTADRAADAPLAIAGRSNDVPVVAGSNTAAYTSTSPSPTGRG